MSNNISHHIEQTPNVYAPNCYHATSRGTTSFPEINQLTKDEYRNSQDFRINRAIVAAGILLTVAVSISTAGAITFAVGVMAHLLLPGSIAAAALGIGSLCTLAASDNFTRIFIKKGDIHHVRWTSGRTESKRDQAETVQAFPTHNGKESFEWKKKLIENAKSRIVLSGNYCGKESFDEILDIMDRCLREKPHLKIVILSSPNFFSKNNNKKLNALTQNYPDRFQLVKTPDKWMDTEQGLKKITNHTKGLVVDGTHFILGGSGIEDKYAYYEGIGDQGRIKIEGGKPKKSWLFGFKNPKIAKRVQKSVLPRGFRDMDFVFSGADMGKKLDQELLQLARLWEHYSNNKGTNTENQNPTVVEKMLAEEIAIDKTSSPFNSETPLQMFEGQCEILCSGPEMVGSPYGERLIEEVKKAKESITIDHMYFHPTQELEDLLVQKVNEGVKLTLVTNGVESFSPTGHKAFGPRNRYAIASIAARVNESCRQNIQMYEFGQKYENTPTNTTLHKKVIVIDKRVVIAGSSNLGYKSTVTSSDHEINFVMTSEQFAEQTLAVIEEDAFKILRKPEKKGKAKASDSDQEAEVPLSQKVVDPRRYLNWRNMLLALRHKQMAWLIG